MEAKLFINGEFSSSSDGVIKKSFNPSNGDVVGTYHVPTIADVDRAVMAAHTAYQSFAVQKLTVKDRADLLLKISEKIKARAQDFIDVEVQDSGSTWQKAKADVHNTQSYFKVMSKVASELELIRPDTAASRAGFSINSRQYMPVGVCAQIIPWNFPLVMAGWKLAPIIATGCTTVLKSAEETPLSATLLAQVLQEVDLPKGMANIITGGAEIGKELVLHPKISKVAFTGSTVVGKEILKNISGRVLNSTLELGGKSANIILNDADLSVAVDGALYAFLYHSGQACDSGTRLLVQEGIYEAFMADFLARIQKINQKPTSDQKAGIGPVISEKQCQSILRFIELSKKEGARLLCGGERLMTDEFKNGYFIQPTAFEITPDHTIFHEEIFGPVVGITKFKTIDEAILLANNSRYGLAGAVWSKNIEEARNIALKLETGTVWINEYHLLNPGMPFGGFKESGLGREMGSEGIMSYLEVKHLWESDCHSREQKPWYNVLF